MPDADLALEKDCLKYTRYSSMGIASNEGKWAVTSKLVRPFQVVIRALSANKNRLKR